MSANEKKISWTEAQKAAISSRGQDLLVSAAAGSGKTAVLTARIIARLTDIDNPVDISRILVVTFTKAAASELKERIAAALTSALKADPADKYLTRQLIKLGKAHISTIHSFCYDLIKNNFSRLELQANVRIADETEMKLKAKDIMNSVIDSYYNASSDGSDIQDFGAFVDTFVTDRDEKLTDTLIALYDKMRSYPEGLNYIKQCADELAEASGRSFFESKWGLSICSVIKRQLEYYMTMYNSALDYIKEDELFSKNYYASFEYDCNYISSLIRALENNDYTIARNILASYSPVKLKTGVKADMQTPQMTAFKDMRTEFSKQRLKISDTYFSSDDGEINSMELDTAKICSDVYSLLCEYDRKLNSEKRRTGIVDYNDLEQFALKLLYNDGGELTDTAISVRERFDEIYIDEYQDINALQDMIFTAVAKQGGRFMVGDIKQSIYGFRGAVPNIFSYYRDTFRNDMKESATLFLSENFRSEQYIIDFTNTVCSTLFTHNSGRVPYYREDDLICAGTAGTPPEKVEIAVINSETANEAAYVACEIKKLLDKGYKASDITLLFRSTKNSAELFEQELEKLNVPFYNNTSHGFFENAEVLLMMCLLNCIDNPSRDIYLAGALKSPIFGVTLDELVNIRLNNPEGTLYDSLRTYIEENGFEKGSYFLEKLRVYREYAEGQPVDKLIWFLYRDTGILSFLEGDDTGHANLMLLYEYARRFESGSFKGLYNFILYVNDIIDERETLENARIFSESSNTVKIMTIHQSKGLEFPVCFLCDAAREFNHADERSNLLTERSLGLAVKLRDETGFARYDTPIRQALALKINENMIDEEIRVLYVALTRAKRKLYVTASSKKPEKLVGESGEKYMSAYTLSRDQCYIKWILNSLAMAESDIAEAYNIKVISDISADEADDESEIDIIPIEVNEPSFREYSSIINERLSFKYPWDRHSKLPAKLSVSNLYPDVLDESGYSSCLSDEPEALKVLSKPKFLEPDAEKATAAERGTATHVFMQFCDFDYIEKHNVKEELARLVAEKFITPASAELVYIGMIERFMNSGLYKNMKSSKQIWREVRFNVKLPASDFTEDGEFKASLEGEHILVQGVIDCFFESSDGKIVLVDYKTDYITREEQQNPESAAAKLIERHSRQLNYYRAACGRLTCRPKEDISAYIYSFGLGQAIECPE